jgi:hypothetical protein
MFASNKYQLIYFTQRRRHLSEDLAFTVRIDGHPIVMQQLAMRVLGVWVDPKLQWKEHTERAANKGRAAFDALLRITALT